MKPKKVDPPPLAFSYLRFSTADQARGDSVRRQTELRDAWLARTGAVLDASLSLEDKGVSGYTGEHRKNPDRNALALFLRQVERGRIPRGSYLLIENLDRLSREHIRPALTLLLNLIDKGVRVVQLTPAEQVFDENVEPMALMMAIMELSRGHSESRMKSERIGKAWQEKKRRAAAGVPMTPCVPAWLRVEGGKIVAIPERVAVVRRIFMMLAAGQGMIQVARRLTTEKVPTFGRSIKWNPSTVHKIAHNRAVLGEFQPRLKREGGRPDGDPIPGYYPAVVPEADWWAVQGALTTRNPGGGRPSARHWNPFAGLLIDARDGGKIYMQGKSSSGPAALVSYNATRGVPGAVRVAFPAQVFFRAVLSKFREIDPADILPDAGDRASRVAELSGRLANLEARIDALQRELEGGDGEVRAAVEALRAMEARREELAGELARARAEAPSTLADAWDDCRTLIDALDAAPDQTDARARLRAALRRAVAEVRCLFVARGRGLRPDRPVPPGKGRTRLAAVQVWFKSGGRRDYLIYSRAGRGNGSVKAGAEWWARTFDAPGEAGGLDLRRREDATALEAALEVGLAADPSGGLEPG